MDDKYQYSCNNPDIRVHGWISTSNPGVGFWLITPTDEFKSGGPQKQNLTSHVGPTTLSVSKQPFINFIVMIILIETNNCGCDNDD